MRRFIKLENIKSFFVANKKYFFISLPVFILLFAVASTYIVKASFGSWGDTSLIHACLSERGLPTIVGPGASCETHETQATWLKDVNAGDGLTISRSSDGATLSLANNDGWNTSSDTWTYASATSFTISGVDRTDVYTPGTKVKFTNNSSTKYGYVKSSSFSSNTTVNLVDNTDYSINNSSITSPRYSYQDNPQGFPGKFSLSTSGVTGFSTIDGYVYEMQVSGRMVHLEFNIEGQSNASTFTLPAPIPVSPLDQYPMAVAVSDGSMQSSPGVMGFNTSIGNTSIIYVGKTFSSFGGNAYGGFSSSGNKGVYGQFFYSF